MAKSKKGRGEGQYTALDYGLLKSAAWRSLSGPAMKVLLELNTRFNGANNGKLHLSLNEAAAILGLGKATVSRANAELQEKGFLVLEVPGNWYSRRAHDWRITYKPTMNGKGRVPPTNEWRTWRPEKQELGSEADPSFKGLGPSQNHAPSCGSVLVPVTGFPNACMGSETER